MVFMSFAFWMFSIGFTVFRCSQMCFSAPSFEAAFLLKIVYFCRYVASCQHGESKTDGYGYIRAFFAIDARVCT